MNMEKSFQIKIGEKVLEAKINDWAMQASGSILVKCGETEVLATCTISEEEKNMGFLPLTVEYQERYYAAGKILGSRFIRRELRPSDEAICTARLIDRTIRPLFPKEFNREIQLIITCLSWDGENDPDIPALLAASLSIALSEAPWDGPLSALRIVSLENKFIVNPSYSEREKAELDLVIVGVKEGREFLANMIEVESQEVSENKVVEAINLAKQSFEPLIRFQEEIINEFGKEKLPVYLSQESDFEQKTKEFLKNKTKDVFLEKDSQKKDELLDNLKTELIQFIEENYPGEDRKKQGLEILEKEQERVFKEKVLKEERPDGRKLDEIREIKCQTNVLSRTHGSGFFSRGQTKALSILTLGAPGDFKILEGMEFIGKKRFIHHYNFPPYSVGEVKFLRGPSRREIGHGMLAEKALLPIVPTFEEFPYSMRIVSEILSSNGSTSMASACASSLALMDGGVPIKRPVAGIAMGLVVKTADSSLPDSGFKIMDYKILTDIQGPEDHYGDMDLKAAGTEKGITAIQMDVKIKGVNNKIIEEVLERAKKARLEILGKMKEVIDKPREKLSPFAPIIKTIQVKPEKIGEVIGPKGKQINEIIEKCEVSIDIEPTGVVYITAEKEGAAEKAVDWIKNITREIEVGEVFQGKVVRIVDFGIFVEIFPGQSGLVHISKIAPYRIGKANEVVDIGDIIPVKVIEIDELGRINLSAVDAGFKPKRT